MHPRRDDGGRPWDELTPTTGSAFSLVLERLTDLRELGLATQRQGEALATRLATMDARLGALEGREAVTRTKLDVATWIAIAILSLMISGAGTLVTARLLAAPRAAAAQGVTP